MSFLCILGRKQTSTENWKLIVFLLGLRTSWEERTRGSQRWMLWGKVWFCFWNEKSKTIPLLCVERGSDYIVLYVARTQNYQNNQTVNMVTSLSIATYACRQNLIKIPRHQIYSEMLPELSAKIPQPQSLLWKTLLFAFNWLLPQDIAFPTAFSTGLNPKILEIFKSSNQQSHCL